MQYISTRGGSTPVSFEDVLLGALALGGGLFVPEAWPALQSENWRSAGFVAVAQTVLSKFAGSNAYNDDVVAAYASFGHPEVAPLVELAPALYLLELFHGPTLAFKDIALQLLARLTARELERRNAHTTILVATSGDTGAAAIAAFGGLPRVQIVVLHPKNRVSAVQRRQMTTTPHENVHNIALEGSFDDAQALVKAQFADHKFAQNMSLTSVNSINFARIIAQIVYYFTAAAKLGRPARFVVPTGNFGDIFAGEAAMHMGLQIAGLIAATNANDVLARTFRTGIYELAPAHATLSPAMDIQVASNFERALFDASGRDNVWLASAMERIRREGKLPIPTPILDELRARYSAESVSDEETLQTIHDTHTGAGRFIDPHTAVALAAAHRLDTVQDTPTVVLATAHPAKFPETVARATGTVPPLPPRLRQSYVGAERYTVLPKDAQRLRHFIENRATP